MGTAAVFAAFILQIRAAPAPQDDIPDSSEVELVEPVNTNTKDSSEADHPVVVVVKPTSFGDVFAGFPGFGHFPTHFKTHFNSVPGFGRIPQTQQVILECSVIQMEQFAAKFITMTKILTMTTTQSHT